MATEAGSERNESKVAEVAMRFIRETCRSDFARRGCGGTLDPTRADLPALEAAVNRLARRTGAWVRMRAPKPRA